ncbi:putative transcriptional regulator, DeoR family [Arthrobacter sp. PAMC 25486]|nr:putative transcriptional regulator, DeoR family [Arthrobacter sp. PAMC 25486]
MGQTTNATRENVQLATETAAAQGGALSRFPVETLYQAAHMYYLEDVNQARIAEVMKVSRPTVSRLLQEARRVGMVKIEVIHPSRAVTESLAAELAEALGLEKVYLADADQSGRLGAGLAPLVGEAMRDMELAPGDILLASSGRTIYELAGAPLPKLPGVIVVPTVGGQTEPEPWYQTNEIARSIAEQTGARPAFLWTQALPSPEMFALLQNDPDFQRIQRLWESAKGALLGIGAPPTTRSSISRFIPKDNDSLSRAAGDICLNFFDADGAEIHFPGSENMIATPPALLRSIPCSVGIAVGTEKARSIVGGANARYFRRLVTDVRTAKAILDLVQVAAA